jgi:hypothetical protein
MKIRDRIRRWLKAGAVAGRPSTRAVGVPDRIDHLDVTRELREPKG